MLMVGTLSKKTISFDSQAEFEAFEKSIRTGVNNNITKADLDKKTKDINILRVGKLNEK
ncbi:hypothetical protein [Ligilactobacillus agilis]|uniref:hypothetical protein n=1 Tax=Ligilactobacillus agilis TaxID=1601 RepID=UPI001CDBD3A3|nr:hypothetical protein [Ligilactobacillus agilis]